MTNGLEADVELYSDLSYHLKELSKAASMMVQFCKEADARGDNRKTMELATIGLCVSSLARAIEELISIQNAKKT